MLGFAPAGTGSPILPPPVGEPQGLAADVVAWQPYSEEALAEAVKAGKPVFIDSFADWCIPCKELDKMTFNQPEVVAASRQFVMLKTDLTSGSDPKARSPTMDLSGFAARSSTGARFNKMPTDARSFAMR